MLVECIVNNNTFILLVIDLLVVDGQVYIVVSYFFPDLEWSRGQLIARRSHGPMWQLFIHKFQVRVEQSGQLMATSSPGTFLIVNSLQV